MDAGAMVNDENWEIDLANPAVVEWFERMQAARQKGGAHVPTAADGGASAYFGSAKAAMTIESTRSDRLSRRDFGRRPFTAEVEVTSPADLAGVGCRAAATASASSRAWTRRRAMRRGSLSPTSAHAGAVCGL